VIFGEIVSQFATAMGFIAATIAVCGFLAHAEPALARDDESDLRRATAAGGLFGFAVAAAVIVASMMASL
jgi:hypothetical protein